MAFHQPKPDAPRCPTCTSAFIYFRVKEENWRCRNCNDEFASPTRKLVRTNGSGQIAGLSYRQQLCRERLAIKE